MAQPGPPQSLDPEAKQGVAKALGRLASGVFILTAQHEDRRAGMVVSWVQQACFAPPMVSVAVAKGRPIMPLISESRRFGLCQIGEGGKVIQRKFSSDSEPGDDPFLGFELIPGVLHNLPILASSMSYLECELACHMDVEGDHDLFVGKVVGGNLVTDTPPLVHLRDDGFQY